MFADIHTHILPAMDDGAVDGNQTLEMLEMACRDGIRHIVATPHFTPSRDQQSGGATVDISAKRNSTDIIGERVRELRELAAGHNLAVEIYPGSEVLIHPDIPSLYETGCICTINQTSYILVEMPLHDIPEYADNVLYQLQLKGLIPIIAHPERCMDIVGNPDILKDFIERGMLAQLNASSLTGRHGRKIRKTALKLIRDGLVQFVASDAHNTKYRTPELSKAAAVVEKKFGSELVRKLFCDNCMAVLENGFVRTPTGKIHYNGLFSRMISMITKVNK